MWTRVTKSFATFCKHLSSPMHGSKNLRLKELNALTVLLRCWGKRVKGKLFEGKWNDKSCTDKDLVVCSANYAWLQSSWAKSFFPAKCALASANIVVTDQLIHSKHINQKVQCTWRTSLREQRTWILRVWESSYYTIILHQSKFHQKILS